MRVRESFLILLSFVVVLSMLVSCSFAYTNDDNSDETEEVVTEDTEIEFKYPVLDPNYEPTLYENLNGTRGCPDHLPHYHVFPDWLKGLVTEDEYTQWSEKLLDGYDWKVFHFYGDGCCYHPKFNVKSFIEEFGITREEFLNAYKNRNKNSSENLYFYEWYDLDILFDGTAEEVSDYYRDFERYYIFDCQYNEYKKLRSKIQSNYDYTLLHSTDNSWGGSDVPEMIYAFNISREQLEDYIVEVRAEVMEALYDVDAPLKKSRCFNYDFDWLYSEDCPVKFNFDDDLTNDVPSYEFDKMFCRVGEYEE